jgi:hypothetical protein
VSDTAALGVSASTAIEAVLSMLTDAGIAATRDPGAFYPQPVGVLVGLPTLTGRGLSFRTFEIPVQVVSGDPLNTALAVDRVYALADDIALVLSASGYRPSSWRSSVNAEPLPAVVIDVTVTVSETGG